MIASVDAVEVSHGVSMNVLDLETLLRQFRLSLVEPDGQIFAGLYSAMSMTWAQQDAFAQDLRQADYKYPDGMGLVWLSNLRKPSQPAERLAMSDFAEALVASANQSAVPIALVGGLEISNRAAAEVMKGWGGDVAYRSAGYWDDDGDEVLARVQLLPSSVVFVGLGPVRQERFCRQLVDAGARHHVYVTCGGLFDHLSGARRRAPRAVRTRGLEWLWRLGQEPKRLTGRYVLGNAYFMARILFPAMWDALRQRRRRAGPG